MNRDDLIKASSRDVKQIHEHSTRLAAQHLYAENIQCLPTHILGAHVNNTLQIEFCTNRRGRYTVLASASFGNDPLLSQPLRKEDLGCCCVNIR
jgi:hypothetical protein